MSFEFPEPKTEDEAQRIKRYLERGAEVSLKEIQSFRSDGTAKPTLAAPATLKIGATTAEVLRVAAAGADRRVLVTIDVGDLKGADQLAAMVYLANPNASARTAPDDPSLAGTLGFFFHSAEHVGPSDSADADQLRYELDANETLKRAQRPGDALTITVVLVPVGKGPAPSAGVTVRGVAVRVVESVVKRAS